MSYLDRAAAEGRVMDFVAPPIDHICERTVQGPLMSGPRSWGLLAAQGTCANGLNRAHVAGMFFGLITRKLWYGNDLTCCDDSSVPVRYALPDRDAVCSGVVLGGSGIAVCHDETSLDWLRCCTGLARVLDGFRGWRTVAVTTC